jgi:hypothetical protein
MDVTSFVFYSNYAVKLILSNFFVISLLLISFVILLERSVQVSQRLLAFVVFDSHISQCHVFLIIHHSLSVAISVKGD